MQDGVQIYSIQGSWGWLDTIIVVRVGALYWVRRFVAGQWVPVGEPTPDADRAIARAETISRI